MGAYSEEYFFFLIGFTLAMHVILNAGEIHDNDSSFLKMHYFFSMSIIYITTIFLFSFFLDLATKFSFYDFFAIMKKQTNDIYQWVFMKLMDTKAPVRF